MHEEIKDEGEGKEDELEDGPGMDSPSLSLSLGSRPFETGPVPDVWPCLVQPGVEKYATQSKSFLSQPVVLLRPRLSSPSSLFHSLNGLPGYSFGEPPLFLSFSVMSFLLCTSRMLQTTNTLVL